MQQQLYNIWNKVPVNYYQTGIKNNFFQTWWHGTKISLAKKIIKDLRFENCLDVGSASGFMVSEIYKDFPDKKFFGIDVYDRAIKFAQKNYPHIKFQVASAEKLPFKDESFDLILCFETIEHIENPQKALKEIKRVIKKDGKVILTMDSGSFLFRVVWWVWEKNKGKVWKDAHLHPFHHRQLEDLIMEIGFKIRKKIFSFLGMEVTFVLKKKQL